MAEQTLFVFGSQGPANFVDPLLTLLGEVSQNPHLAAFFQQAVETIRADIIGLKDPTELSVLPPISTFSSLTTLARWHDENGYQNATVNGLLLVVTQVAQVIKAWETLPKVKQGLTAKETQFAGFCTGAITAAALAVEIRSIWDVIRQGVQAIRLVFFISLRSHQVAEKLNVDSAPWSYALTGVAYGEAADLIKGFNETVGGSKDADLVITASTVGSVSIGGQPAQLELFSTWVNSKLADTPARCTPLKIFSPYHNKNLLSETVELVLDDQKSRKIALLEEQEDLRPLYDVVTGGHVSRGIAQQDLLKYLVEVNYLHCNRFDTVGETFAKCLPPSKSVRVFCAAPSFGLATSIREQVGQHNPQTTVECVDLGAQGKEEGVKTFVTPENDTVAIVAMSCRLPGGIENPDDFWRFLKAGKSSVGEIPKHLFNIDDYFGDGVNQTRVRHMHALPEDVVTTMDIRIPNISPKEAEQMDPQHRLSILLAYEALEKAGYSPQATQSFDNRRIAYFATVTSDDYRENASGAPSGISSYFISGCIRAFVPGALSFALNLEGPSNSIDSGETSSLVTLEHAQAALQARQCDVALAGAFTVLTSPQLFIGYDVDGHLSHTGVNNTFAAVHDGVTRADAAVVFVMKRLSDAIKEGDEILATLPGSYHRSMHNVADASEQVIGLKNSLSLSGVQPASIVHVEASGYYDAAGEAAQFQAIDSVFAARRKGDPLTVGSVQPNFGCSEAALGAIGVMKAVLMLEHNEIPKHLPVANLNSSIARVQEAGRTLIPFREGILPGDSTNSRVIAVHGLALSGAQAVTFVKDPPTIARLLPSKDSRTYHVLALSAKTRQSVEQMRENLIKYLKDDCDLLRLSYTLTARRLAHPFRIVVVASSPQEARERLSHAPVSEIRDQQPSEEIALLFTGQFGVGGLEKLCKGDRAFQKSMEYSLAMAQAGGLDNLTTERNITARLTAVRGEMAVFSMLQSWGVHVKRIHAVGTGVIAALAAAKAIAPQEALLLAVCNEKSAGILWDRIASRSVAVELDFGIGIQPIGAPLDVVLIKKALAGSSPPTTPSSPLTLSIRDEPWKDLSQFSATLFSAGYAINWTAYFSSFLPGLRHLTDFPAYPFTLTRHWIDYRDRNLIREEAEDGKSSVDASTNDNSTAASLPKYPMLGRVARMEIDGDHVLVCYESSISAAPMISFIMGHLVNNAPLAPATLYADLCMEAAEDVSARLSPHSSALLRPELRDLEIIRPLTVNANAEARQLLVELKGNTIHQVFTVEISSIGKAEDTVKHMSAKVALVDSTSAWDSWTKMAPLVSNQVEHVRKSPEADVIASKLAYSAFESVVSYTEDSGFRGIQSVALLESTFEAVTVVRMDPQAPSSTFVVNPCHIDSLGQITGFICNSTADAAAVYIADGVKAMRFSHELTVAASAGKEFHVYCRMHPAKDLTSFTGDAYFLNAENKIVGEMEGVRYKRVPRAVLDMLLPNPKQASAGARAGVPAKRATVPADQQKASVSPQLKSQAQQAFDTIMHTVAVELGIDRAELQLDKAFADLGLDSLMQLVILGSLQNLPVELPPSLFLECVTPQDLLAWLNLKIPSHAAEASFLESPTSTSVSTEGSPPTAGTGKAASALAFAKTVIATELGIEQAELDDDTDLAAAGCDSLMSLLILGTLNNELGIDLPPSLFVECNTLKELGAFFASTFQESVPQVQALQVSKPPLENDIPKLNAELLKGVRVQKPTLLQKKEGAINLFLFPDGSGAAAAYASLPTLGSCNLYGLNSPFMGSPSAWQGGVTQLALAYLSSVRMVQPTGSISIGGWSFGGVAAFELCRLLSSSSDPNDRVDLLLLLDSPSPTRFPPLPMSVVDWIFASADIPAPPSLSKRLVAHFQATVDSLAAYGAPPAIMTNPPRRVALLTARNGLTVKEKVPDANATVNWLIEPRHGLGANGWQELLPSSQIDVHEFEANHFTMMHPPWVHSLASLISRVLAP